MITQQNLKEYKGVALLQGKGYLYAPPHHLLRPYISNYTFTFPLKASMTDQYTILPAASVTIVFSADNKTVQGNIQGANTKSSVVGAYANQFSFLLLIEFHPGGFFPFVKLNQQEIQDISLDMDDIHRDLNIQIQEAMIQLNTVEMLIQRLNHIFLSYIQPSKHESLLLYAMDYIIKKSGVLPVSDLAREVFYSGKQLNRFFKQYIGVNVKTFSRVVRINHILRMMETENSRTALLAQAGQYFDQSHFVHDFKSVCGITPQVYLKNKSIFYNELFKL